MNMLASELFDTNLGVPACGNWNDVIFTSSNHGVIPLLSTGIANISSVPDEVLHIVRSSAIKSAYWGEQLLNIQNELLTALHSNDMPCAIYKGASVATCYPHPELRQHGDIDILVRQNDFLSAADLLEGAGCVRHGTKHSFHTSFSKNGVSVELHRAVSCFPDNSAGQYCIDLFSHALDQISSSTINEWAFPVLLPKYQLLSLLFHMERHMTSSSIGLRQLCDWAVCVYRYRDVIDDDMLSDFARCGVLPFARVLTQTCTHFLGMSQLEWSRSVDKIVVSRMINEVLDGGIARSVSPDRSFSCMFVRTPHLGIEKTWVGSLITKLSIKARTRYSIVNRFPFLLPAFWIYIPLKSVVRSRKNGNGKWHILSIMSIARKRRKLYRDLHLFVSKQP